MDVRAGELSAFRINVEDIANSGYLYVQIILLQLLLIACILAILFIGLLHLIDPGRLSKTGSTHQLLAANTETNHTQPNLLAVWLRLQIISLLVANLKDI